MGLSIKARRLNMGKLGWSVFFLGYDTTCRGIFLDIFGGFPVADLRCLKPRYRNVDSNPLELDDNNRGI